nr:MAG TPA: hypothetical protein [Bacteriophage sp.]
MINIFISFLVFYVFSLTNNYLCVIIMMRRLPTQPP